MKKQERTNRKMCIGGGEGGGEGRGEGEGEMGL